MLKDLLDKKLVEALKGHDDFLATLIRGTLSALHNRAIELRTSGKDLIEKDEQDVVRKEIKKRKDAQALYISGNRPELAQKEEKEAEFLATLLPEQLSEDAVRDIVKKVLQSYPSPSAKDMGSIIKAVMEASEGNADGSMVSRVVKEALVA